MVVTLLALLFVIVSGYLTLARFDRQTLIIAQQGNTTDEIVNGVNHLVLSLVREQWLDSEGELFTGKPTTPPPNYEYSTYEDIGGYRKSHWQAASEPVLDATASGHELERYRWAAISALHELAANDPTRQPFIRNLMLENDRDTDTILNFDLNDPNNDLRRNARLGLMDADGDGVPDAGLMASALATELANNMAGRSVRLRGTGIDPSRIPQDGNNTDLPGEPGSRYWDDFWRRYNDLARYEVAVRVVPHGGMVSLGLPYRIGSAPEWNHEFARRMFSWLGTGKQGVGSPPTSQLMGELYAEAAAIEPALRRRGGLLPSYRPQGEQARVPDLLRQLEEDNWGIFAAPVNGEVPWQRFNLAVPNADEWILWRNRMFLDPARVKDGDVTALGDYDCRHLITTVSYSDDVAREQTATLPAGALPGIRQGQLKFYLGDIAQAFDPQTGAFLGDGGPGTRIVHRLAGYFHEMLSAYTDWPDWPARPGWTALTEEQKRFRQAYMLAVNTVAFAAPRQANGFIDVVTATASFEPLSTRVTTYIGYAPQPFVTQILVYDKDPGGNSESLALAVELFNPNDPTDLNPRFDHHALDLSQFCITLNNANPNTNPGLGRVLSDPQYFSYPRPGRMSGRSFIAFAVRGVTGNTAFDSYFTNNRNGVIDDLAVDFSGNSLKVKLWRLGTSPAAWYLVDELEIGYNLSTQPDDDGWWATAYRDMQGEAYFGDYSGSLPAPWRMAVNFQPGNPLHKHDEREGHPGEDKLRELGLADPTLPGGPRLAPTVPLYTMNAAARNDWPVHGALRPRSLPTVGFMLFVPRFSHTKEVETTIPATVHRPISVMLEAVWNDEGYGVTTYPADFGHMAIFDNTQDLDSGGYGDYFADDEAGKVPWGLLVFDYFTTLDPNMDANGDGVPDVDPYRVPGRININAAPWFVLAGLPVIGGPPGGDLPLHPSASPAFWSTQSGILAGVALGPDGAPNTPDDIPRSLLYWTSYHPTPLAHDGWWRLGMDLALSVAEYRDRIAYIDPTPASPSFPYRWSYLRNGAPYLPAPPTYRVETRYGGIRRGDWDPVPGSSNAKKYGFLTLGELANVKGFDSATYLPGGDPAVFDPLAAPGANVVGGDFVRAVSLLALLDTHFLTTRSNTFTAYVTVRDRQNAQQSVRSQITVDRSNILPRLVLDVNGDPLFEDADGDGSVDDAVVITNNELPETIAERRVGYGNARFDD